VLVVLLSLGLEQVPCDPCDCVFRAGGAFSYASNLCAFARANRP